MEGITKLWFLRLIIASLLVEGGVELNLGPTLEDKLMEILAGQRENVTTVNECKERNKTSMDEVCMKLDKLNENAGGT